MSGENLYGKLLSSAFEHNIGECATDIDGESIAQNTGGDAIDSLG